MGSSFQMTLRKHRSLRTVFLTPIPKRSIWDRLTFELRAGALMTKLSKRYGAFVPVNCDIGQDTRFLHDLDGIHIGGEVVIGDRCTIGHHVTIGRKIGSDDHMNAPTIGNDVFIGTGAIVLGRCRIGHGAKIGAGVVLVDATIPAGAMIVNCAAFDITNGVPVYPAYKTKTNAP